MSHNPPGDTPLIDAFADLGFTPSDAQPRPASQQLQTHHSWKLIAQQRGQSRHRCIHCHVIRTSTQGEGVPQTRYTWDNSSSDRAPACRRMGSGL
jgi:hypothetical protein